MRSILIASACLATGLALTPASAQRASGLGSYADPYWGRQGGLICRRWCLDDRNPCDPVQYKEADGRCNGERTFWGVLNCRIQGETRPECPTFRRSR